jgi:hypothetical protein
LVRFAGQFAALPGVVGLGLVGSAAPGYPDAEIGDWPLWIGGFTTEVRLAFLRTHATDPADLIPASPFTIEREPASRGLLRELWSTEQRQRRDQALARFQTALRAAQLSASLSVCVGQLGRSGHWQRWRGFVPLEEAPLDLITGERPPLVADAAQPGLLHIRVLAYESRLSGLGAELSALFDADAQFREWLDLELQPVLRPTPDHPDHWEGFVIDISDQPLATGIALLEKAFQGNPKE